MPEQQAKTVDLPHRIPLVIEPQNRSETTSFDARLVNAYMETRKAKTDLNNAQNETWIYERVGLLEQSQPSGGAAAGLGCYLWRGNLYAIFDGNLYKDGVAVGAGLDTSNGVYRFDSCLGATPKLQMGNGVAAYNYDSAGGLVQIVDADFPSSFVKGWCYLDGTTYVMTPSAHILGSDINDPTSWDPLNDILAQIEPDQGMALGKQLVYAVAFKEWTTEIFYDAGNTSGSPLGRVEGAKVNYGCASEDSVRELDGALYWLATNRNAGLYVCSIDNLKAEIVSTKAIERLLDDWTIGTIYSWTMKHDGHKFYGLTSVEDNMTLVYDAAERMWSQWTDVNGNYWPIASSTYNTTFGHILQHATNGKLYLADTSYATDDGDIITVDIITPNYDGGTRRRKQNNMLTLVGDRQQGSQILVRMNDRDYNPKSWTNWRILDMSRQNPRLTGCGTFVRRIHHFRHQKPVRMPRIMAVELQLDIGTI